jgi:hypothetical protein
VNIQFAERYEWDSNTNTTSKMSDILITRSLVSKEQEVMLEPCIIAVELFFLHQKFIKIIRISLLG